MNFNLKTQRFNYKKLIIFLLNVGGFGDNKSIYISYNFYYFKNDKKII
jgi:hypothetical protein